MDAVLDGLRGHVGERLDVGDGQTGIVWLLDAYTWTDHFPYSEPVGGLNYIGTIDNCQGDSCPRGVVASGFTWVGGIYASGQGELVDAMNHPGNPDFGTRELPFSRDLSLARISEIYRDIARKTAAKLSLQAKDYAAKFPRIVIQNN
mgnify:CR=1 FL=1